MTYTDTDTVALLHDLADLSGKAILPHFRRLQHIDNKAVGDRFDPVTQADRDAEMVIRKTLASRRPGDAILGEEFDDVRPDADADTGNRWVIDPIDGTRAFVLGFPTWGTLIGLEHAGVPRLGMMNQPFTGERFWSDGTASYFSQPGEEASKLATRRTRLAEARLSTTSPDLFALGEEQSAYAAVAARAQDKRYGGDCYAYCLLAAGQLDIVIEAGLKPYDIVALIPIIENAGGIVTNWTGGPASNGGRVLACGDRGLHAELLDVVAAEIK